jgi:hypothetical protein
MAYSKGWSNFTLERRRVFLGDVNHHCAGSPINQLHGLPQNSIVRRLKRKEVSLDEGCYDTAHRVLNGAALVSELLGKSVGFFSLRTLALAVHFHEVERHFYPPLKSALFSTEEFCNGINY